MKALEVEREKEREEDGKKESLKKALSLDTKKSLLRFARSSSRSLTRLIDAFLVRSQVGVVLFSKIASVKRSSGGALSLSLSLSALSEKARAVSHWRGERKSGDDMSTPPLSFTRFLVLFELVLRFQTPRASSF